MVSLSVAASLIAIVLGLPSPALSAQGDCGQPVTGGANPAASDCLFILRAAIGAETCDPACICNTSGDAGTTATDALICLKKAVGQFVPLVCPCEASTSTTSPPTTIPTTTTTTPGGGHVLEGVLPRTTGRFNYDLVLGLPGADAACNSNFSDTHACTFADLLNAESADELVDIKDTNGFTVTSFWAIDSSHTDITQCHTVVPWDYATAHTGHFAEVADLDNDSGDLGPVEAGVCATQSWVGCCL